MAKTITDASLGIVLTAANYATYNPLSITATGSVESAIGSAIYSDAAEAWTVTNAGTIESSQPGSTYGGVVLKAGGTVTNTGAGVISGVAYGVYITGTSGANAVVTNAGGTITGTGASGVGVALQAGGTVTNAGTITGTGGTAVLLGSGASRVVFDPGAVFNGGVTANASYANTLELASGSSIGTLADLAGLFPGFTTVTVDVGAQWQWAAFGYPVPGVGDTITNGISLINAGTLLGPIYTQTGGSVTNQAGGRLSMAGYGINMRLFGGTLINQGVIVNPNASSGIFAVYLQNDAYATNASTGTITAFTDGVRISRSGTFVNAGTVSATGSNGEAVYTYEHGIVTNNGTISASGRSGLGVFLHFNGLLTNNGLITATGSKGYALAMGGDPYLPRAYNNGTITATGSLSYGAQNRGGYLTNNASGRISGVRFGVFNTSYYNGQPPGTLVNFGTISATSTLTATKSASVGVYTGAGDPVTNEAGGIITAIATGLHGVSAPVINAGTIRGSGTAGLGVELTGGTLTNAGTIVGNGGTAVSLDGKITNLLIVDPGAAFLNSSGGAGIVRGVSGASTLELASGSGAGALGGFGSEFVNFATIAVDAGAAWTLGGANTLASTTTLKNAGTLTLSGATLSDAGIVLNNGTILIDPSSLTIQNLSGVGAVTIGTSGTLDITGSAGVGETITFSDVTGILQITPGTFASTIDGFFAGDTISLTGVLDATGVSVVNRNTLAVARSGNPTIDLTLDPARDVTHRTFNVAEVGGNAVVTTGDMPCFAEGTHIETPRGPVAVDELAAGDLVCTPGRGVRPVRWIGFRRLDLARYPAPERVRPVRIRASAFAEGVPCRDLRLSPDHAVLVDEGLVPIRLLVNGASIGFETNCRTVTYYHVELDSHDVLLAERLAAESYLDTGNRSMFANGGVPARLHPDFGNDQARRLAGSCVPLLTDAATVEPIWGKLAARSAALGWCVPPAPVTTRDPALCVVAGERVMKPLSRHDGRHVFVLPRIAGSVRLVSRAAVPSAQRPWVEDRRRLGVMVARLMLRTDDAVCAIPLDHPGIGAGWWGLEREGGRMCRWTDGDAALALRNDGVSVLEVELAGTLAYPVEKTVGDVRSAAGSLAA